ncbi:hypothetical protein APHAL10511_007689 [Amanita phalloides]|nr:hypothetical protein APHAL10511_007689 [Amanita phalloides]
MSSYAVLSVSPDATDDEVRRAYKHKALECHPDRHVKDKDIATQSFIELNTAYHAILSERARNAAISRASEFTRPPAKSPEQQAGTKNDPKPPKAPPSSGSSTRSFKSHSFPASSTPSSTPPSSPFTSPSSSPYSTPASSPASSTTSLPDEKDSSPPKRSATCEDADEDHSSTTCSSSTGHTAKPPSDHASSAGTTPTTPKPPRAKLRKQPPKPNSSTSSPSTSSHDYECRNSHTRPTYTASSTKFKSSDTGDTHLDADSNTHSHSSKHPKVAEIELREYYNSFPSLKDYPRVDLAPEWVYPLQLTLEDIFRGSRLCYRIRRRYLSGKTKAVVLDVDVPAGCRSGTKIVFRDAGHERRDGTRQDLVFIVREVKHARFVRGYEWDGGGGNDRDVNKDDKERRRDRDHSNKSSGSKTRKSHKYGEDDLVMEVRLPWVDRLKEEIAKVVISGVDGKEVVFEVDCRNTKGGSSGEKETEKGKMTGIYIVEGAGMPVRSDIRRASGGGCGEGTGVNVDANGTGQRGRFIIRWEIFVPTSSSSPWESFKQMFKFGK